MAESASPGQRWTLTEAAFNKLLICLDPDRARAGEQYEMIRRKLVKFFEFRGSLAPEDYADETINRVAQKVDQGETLLNPSSYFHGVARMIFMESLRAQEKERLGLELEALNFVPVSGENG